MAPVSLQNRHSLTSPRLAALYQHLPEIEKAIKQVGGSNLRVFGSVARGEDNNDSDIDLVFSPTVTLSLMQLERLQAQLTRIVDFPIDLSPDTVLRPDLRTEILKEAITL